MKLTVFLQRALKVLFFLLIVKPMVLFLLGVNIRGKQYLPRRGGAVIAANHNSHLDTLVLMSLYPLSQLHRIRPVAAADYFFKNKMMTWFSLHCLGLIGLQRQGFQRPRDAFAECFEALDNGDILIIFPEGSRGEPEQLGALKQGLFYLHHRESGAVPVTPVMLRGLGNALPKGEALFVPFNCDVVIGEPLPNATDRKAFAASVYTAYQELATNCLTK